MQNAVIKGVESAGASTTAEMSLNVKGEEFKNDYGAIRSAIDVAKKKNVPIVMSVDGKAIYRFEIVRREEKVCFDAYGYWTPMVAPVLHDKTRFARWSESTPFYMYSFISNCLNIYKYGFEKIKGLAEKYLAEEIEKEAENLRKEIEDNNGRVHCSISTSRIGYVPYEDFEDINMANAVRSYIEYEVRAMSYAQEIASKCGYEGRITIFNEFYLSPESLRKLWGEERFEEYVGEKYKSLIEDAVWDDNKSIEEYLRDCAPKEAGDYYPLILERAKELCPEFGTKEEALYAHIMQERLKSLEEDINDLEEQKKALENKKAELHMEWIMRKGKEIANAE